MANHILQSCWCIVLAVMESLKCSFLLFHPSLFNAKPSDRKLDVINQCGYCYLCLNWPSIHYFGKSNIYGLARTPYCHFSSLTSEDAECSHAIMNNGPAWYSLWSLIWIKHKINKPSTAHNCMNSCQDAFKSYTNELLKRRSTKVGLMSQRFSFAYWTWISLPTPVVLKVHNCLGKLWWKK